MAIAKLEGIQESASRWQIKINKFDFRVGMIGKENKKAD